MPSEQSSSPAFADFTLDRPPAPVEVTVIIPTFNESGNIVELVSRLSRSTSRADLEILFVDDSNDDTPSVIGQVMEKSAVPVRLIHRPAGQRDGGLAGAVTLGLSSARGRYAVVMDGDLQHPPELVPLLHDKMLHDGTQLVVASRYCGEGDASGLDGGWRKYVSRSSTLAARGAFPRRVGRRCTDPMTGFFCVDRSAVDVTQLQARGFKILLEILVRHDLRVAEIPFTFGERNAGESKASWRRGLEFAGQLMRLRFSNAPVKFAAVGIFGALLNLAIMAGLLASGTGYLAASVIASEITIVTNFLLQEKFVFANSDLHARAFKIRALHSFVVNNTELLIRLPLLALMVRGLGIPSLPAAAIALVIAFVGRYLFLSKVTYRRKTPKSAAFSPMQARPADEMAS